jgi:hypothetical protein
MAIQHYDFQEAQELMYTKEVLSQEERDMCMHFMPAMAEANLFHHSWNNTWLNLNVYSEYDHEKRQFEMETGVVGSYDDPNYLRA